MSSRKPGARSSSQPLQDMHDRVAFGIVTALLKEYVAMKAMLDEPVDVVASRGRPYCIGQIPAAAGGIHYIALALADQGTTVATNCAALLAEDHPSIEAVLMVGIAGGVPDVLKPERHVRLGDVVVSGLHGIIAYDFGKAHPDRFEPRYPPRPPHARLHGAARLLEAGSLEGKRPWTEHVHRAAHLSGVARPAIDSDRLADSHDPTRWLNHPPDVMRREGEPRVFLGAIASANVLLKNPVYRDQLRDRFGVLAVEMEGSGIAEATWNQSVGYLVVRGVCDYCDSHKGDAWQEYASVAAAAYTRALLMSLDFDGSKQLRSSKDDPARAKRRHYDKKTTEGRRHLVAALRRNHSISDSEALATRIAGNAAITVYSQGDVIIAEGDLSSDVHFILEGKVDVVRGEIVKKARTVFDHVGEMAAIEPGVPRSATIRAATDVVTARLTADQFDTIANEFPHLWKNVARELARRLREYL